MGLRNFAEGLEEHALPVRYLRIGEHPYCGFADALSKECLCFFILLLAFSWTPTMLHLTE